MNATSLNRSQFVTTVIIGAGHNGLAMSHSLRQHGIDHVVLERGQVANTWNTERWDSLKLLTPNWQCSLPGFNYSGDDPDGFMPAKEVAEFIQDYAELYDLPVETDTTVESVEAAPGTTPGTSSFDNPRYLVKTNRGTWLCQSLVLANGNFSQPKLPKVASLLPEHLKSLTAHDYRKPEQVEKGGVLIVGASATGLQLAAELREAGHEVSLAIGEHVRLPRTYRARDIQWWMHALGLLKESYLDADDLNRVRRLPSPQLVGTNDRSTLDLNALSDAGVQLVGRLMGVSDINLQFSGSVANVCKLADLKMNRLLDKIDAWVEEQKLVGEAPPERFEATKIPAKPALQVNTITSNIKTVIWATGYRADHGFINLPVFDHRGLIQHDGGIVIKAPGIYTMGATFLRHRQSSFISGAVDDAKELSAHLANYVRNNHILSPEVPDDIMMRVG